MSAPIGKQNTGVHQQYVELLAQKRFMVQRCSACTAHVFPPREICPRCDADNLDWIIPSGRGVVYSHTTIARKPDAGGDYNVSLINLEEGVRLMACVVGIAPMDVCVDMPVHASVEETGGANRVIFTVEASS